MKVWALKRAKSARLNFGAFEAVWSHGVDSGLSNSNFEINLRQIEVILKQNDFFWKKMNFF